MYKDEIYARGQSIQIYNTAIKPRLDSIDILRGVVMILMALDHVRDFFTNVRFDPLDLSQTSVELFFTRWITHFCAPVFVFLAGTGAFLSMGSGKSKTDVTKFLLSRELDAELIGLDRREAAPAGEAAPVAPVGQVIWALG